MYNKLLKRTYTKSTAAQVPVSGGVDSPPLVKKAVTLF